jgi:hypothetical protein
VLIAFPVHGGINLRLKGDDGGSLEVETLIGPGEWYMIRLKDGMQIGFLHKMVSKDGKTMTQRSRFRSARGEMIEQLLVYDRQDDRAR